MIKKVFYIWIFIKVFSVVNAFSAGSIEKSEITKVAFQSNHFFIYSNGWNNPNNCQNINAVVLKSDDSNFENAYTLLLAAYMAGKEVSGYSDGCIEWDGKTYNTIRGHKYLAVQ